MKVVYKERVGGHTIVKFVSDAAVDNEKTREKIAPLIKPEMTEEEAERLYMDNLVYAKVGEEAKLVGDAEGERLQQKLEAIKDKKQALLVSGECIDDCQGVEYWLKKSGKWAQEKISGIGVPLPVGAILPGSLTEGQNKEIAAQREAERIAAMTAKQKAEEMRSKLHALAREANQKAADAELLGESFDKQAWFQPKKAEVEKLYA